MRAKLNNLQETIIVFAARYAITRSTGAALTVVNYIKSEWSQMSVKAKSQILRESINEHYSCSEDWKELAKFAGVSHLEKPVSEDEIQEILYRKEQG